MTQKLCYVFSLLLSCKPNFSRNFLNSSKVSKSFISGININIEVHHIYDKVINNKMTTLSLKRIWNSFFGNFRIIQIKIIKYFELFLRFSEKYNFYISYYKKMFVLLTYFVKLQFLFFFFIKNTTLQPNTTWCHQMQPKTNSYIFSKKKTEK